MSHQEHFFLEYMPAVFISPKSTVTGIHVNFLLKKKLYSFLSDCTSEADFGRRQGLSDSYAERFWRLWTDDHTKILKFLSDETIADLLVEGENLFGELGIYNLEY